MLVGGGWISGDEWRVWRGGGVLLWCFGEGRCESEEESIYRSAIFEVPIW